MAAIRDSTKPSAPTPRRTIPKYEILFGVKDPADPAVEDIRRLKAEFPERDIRLVFTTRQAPNGKVAVLADLAGQARYPILLVNDSDILVEPDYLRRVVAPLEDPKTGVVTCLYRARAETWPGRWEAIGIATDFAPGVLVAPLVGVAGFALGSTMVFRAEQLAQIGGFAALESYIADDYQLGAHITRLGLSRRALESSGRDKSIRRKLGRSLAPPTALVPHDPRLTHRRLLRIPRDASRVLVAGSRARGTLVDRPRRDGNSHRNGNRYRTLRARRPSGVRVTGI